jgi:hypothetical protein
MCWLGFGDSPDSDAASDEGVDKASEIQTTLSLDTVSPLRIATAGCQCQTQRTSASNG